ncbi:hypothetical protein [Bosea sp. NBC_00550]|uniref:hypothetical protein n=1 Tax=Bosea sp. NBC_00550 TaxID=2969621 RepID=UPI0022311746|nr:hypothetical protein [Bosea sp. NBC_00550]UZF92948.1 hypothetical protein NWE53_01640 [Bosea sp. NBC_00550]
MIASTLKRWFVDPFRGQSLSEGIWGLAILAMCVYGIGLFASSKEGLQLRYGEQFMAAYGDCLNRNEKAIAAQGMTAGIEFCIRKESYNLSNFANVENYVIPPQGDKMGPRFVVRNTSPDYAISLLNITLYDQPRETPIQGTFVGAMKPGATGQVFFPHGAKVDQVRYRVTEAWGFRYDASPPAFR